MKSHLSEFKKIMHNANIDEIVIRSFEKYYKLVLSGETGKLSEKDISPPDEKNIIKYNDLKISGSSSLEKLAVIKLNGGLGTSMGLKKAKTLLKVKRDLNFLDIISLQILHLRQETGKEIPLLFMNSFNTRDDTLSYLEKYPELKIEDLPLDFVQNKFPKIKQSDLSPLKNVNDNLNWNPPGHGEVYLVMLVTGILEKLIELGFEYIFISNSDNLGAVVDEEILDYFAENKLPFMMEVCRRSDMDKKGGHLAQTKSGQLILRETAQCPDDETEFFQNIDRYRYFNTNSLWVNLKSLKKKLEENDNLLPLSLIVNPKEVDGEKVFQLESAMGAAISVFEGSKAMIVDRDRFAPVKKTNDLLVVWSDVYKLQDDYRLVLENDLKEPPKVHLDERYYKTINQLEEHFKEGIPSLKNCRKLEITNDVYFEKNVEIIGEVAISEEGKIKEKKL